MSFGGFGKNSGPNTQPGAQTPFGNSPRHPVPSSPLPVSPRKKALTLGRGSPTDMDQPGKPSATPTPTPTPSQLFSPPPELHQSDANEDDENVKQLQECSSVYIALQDCLLNSNRNWKSCQKEVQLLKACNDRRNK